MRVSAEGIKIVTPAQSKWTKKGSELLPKEKEITQHNEELVRTSDEEHAALNKPRRALRRC